MKETTDLGIQKIGFIYEYVIKKSHENIAESISTHCVADQNKVSKHVSNINC